ncbi:DNA-directed RNA polymerase subunit beta [Candidatus Poribacteria bacterium]|nr:DNA-directed RNA polymerase subunit beta [Candidatus Poribacteria bacterium]
MPQSVKKYDKPVKYYGKRERLSYGKIPEILDLPDLIEVQKSSYEEFLQRQILPNSPLIGRVIATPVEHPTTGDVLLETNTELTKEQIDELLKADISDVEVSHEHKTERVSLREDKGLQAVLNEIFPIPDFSETNELRFVSYSLGVPKYDINECQSRGFSYALPVKVRVRLVLREKDEDTGENLPTEEIIENEVYMGEIPLMTENGTFIINGSERVIVSQLQRSPGATFGEDTHTSGQILNTARIIPYRGAWIEFEYDIKDMIYVRLDRRKKMLVTVLLRALGWETDETILKLYAKTEQVKLDKSLIDRVTAAPIRYPATEELLLEANTELTQEQIDELREAKVKKVEVLDADDAEDIRFLRNTLKRDLQSDYNLPLIFEVSSDEVSSDLESDLTDGELVSDAWHQQFKDNGASLSSSATVQVLTEGRYRISNKNSRDNFTIEKAGNTLKVHRGTIQDLAVVEIFRKMQPGDPPTIESAHNRFEKLFFDPVRYDLAEVGRYKLNEKLGNLSLYRNGDEEVNEEVRVLRKEDIAAVLQYLIQVQNGEGEMDDIDHLGNRRVRAVGELLQNQVRMGMLRVTRATRERLTVQDLENVTPADLINPKPLTAAIKDFFGSSQLSQFMQQANPLDELTHKRRLSALGPGGLHRERATFEVRDVHRTHYGRVCPIETPEGPSVGLIVSLSTYARVNAYGFMETPYRKVSKGKATDQIDYLAADKEDTFTIAQAHAVLDEKGTMEGDMMVTRHKDDFPRKSAPEIDYIDVSPKQIVGVSAALIPFLEHNDANRALMGSNMQRQAVPLIRPEAPLIGTGMEHKAARDSGAVVLAKRDGVVESVSAAEIIIRTDDAFRIAGGEQSFSEMGYDVYRLTTFKRSNSGTSLHQRPCVDVGEEIKASQVIADGTSTENGELALGSNVLIAFMSWEGYNYEDAILLSESLITDDIYTSIHIEEFEVEARDTKMGREEITRDIPNVSEEALAQLDEEGIIRIGSVVRPGSILVGKVTPKGESDLGPEEKLLRAIFGEKVGEVRDASKYVKPGTEGVVVDVKVFSRKEREPDRQTRLRELAKEKEVEKEWEAKRGLINQRKDAEIRNALLGKKLASSVSDGTNLIAKKGRIVTEKLLDAGIPLEDFHVANKTAMELIERIQQLAQGRLRDLEEERDAQIEKIRKGDELKPGVLKLVKVYVATRRKISVGDKMSGRHGNKGVVSKILPQEDMPYLEDGTPIQIIMNPLGVPGRMNAGQILETHLGRAARELGLYIATPVFDGAEDPEIRKLLKEAGLPEHGKAKLYDGRSGEPFAQEVTVGYTYILKLNHLVDDKIHARSTGPYSLVTQQPLGGKAQQGGQRLGEMEVWALEAYGAAYTLQELLTIKSDDVVGRSKIYEAIVKGENAPAPGTPESFNVLVKELQSLCLDVDLEQTSDDLDTFDLAPEDWESEHEI